MTVFSGKDYNGFYLFQKEFTFDHADVSGDIPNGTLATSYRMGNSFSSNNTQEIINFFYAVNVIINAAGIFLETEDPDITITLSYKDGSVTDLVTIPVIKKKKSYVFAEFDLTTMTSGNSSFSQWLITIDNPNAADFKIRHSAVGEMDIFEKPFSKGIIANGHNNSMKAIGLPKTGLPYGRKFYNRTVSFSGNMSFVTPNSEQTRFFFQKFQTLPCYLVWNMQPLFGDLVNEWESLLIYRDKTKANEKYDTNVSNAVLISGRAYA